MAVIERFWDRSGREVVLTEAGWAHIIGRHPELAGRRDEIRMTVASPHFVHDDAKYAHRENHYRRTDADAPYLKVVVHYRPVPPQGTWIGEVRTAHPTGIVPAKEEPLWP